MEENNIQIVKINQPDYIQKVMWPLIVESADRMKKPGMSAHSLMTYFLYGVIGKSIELWGAISNDNKCMGFVTFQVLGAPHYSTGLCSYIYINKNANRKDIYQLFCEQFVDFMKRNSLKYFVFHSQYKRLAEKWKNDLVSYGMNTKNEEYILIGTRKIGEE